MIHAVQRTRSVSELYAISLAHASGSLEKWRKSGVSFNSLSAICPGLRFPNFCWARFACSSLFVRTQSRDVSLLRPLWWVVNRRTQQADAASGRPYEHRTKSRFSTRAAQHARHCLQNANAQSQAKQQTPDAKPLLLNLRCRSDARGVGACHTRRRVLRRNEIDGENAIKKPAAERDKSEHDQNQSDISG